MEQFIKDLREWNIDISDEQLNLFERFTALLLEWNEKINLTAITDLSDIYKKHYLDSLSLIKKICFVIIFIDTHLNCLNLHKRITFFDSNFFCKFE